MCKVPSYQATFSKKSAQSGFIQAALLFGIALMTAVLGGFALANRSPTSQTDVEQAKVNASVILKQASDLRDGVARYSSDFGSSAVTTEMTFEAIMVCSMRLRVMLHHKSCLLLHLTYRSAQQLTISKPLLRWWPVIGTSTAPLLAMAWPVQAKTPWLCCQVFEPTCVAGLTPCCMVPIPYPWVLAPCLRGQQTWMAESPLWPVLPAGPRVVFKPVTAVMFTLKPCKKTNPAFFS